MRYLKFFTCLLLLITFPTTLIYPQNHIVSMRNMEHPISQTIKTNKLLSYDDVINLLDEIESGELEEKYTQEDLERIDDFLILLAREGVLQTDYDNMLALENDIEDLLHGENCFYDYAFSTEATENYMIFPADLDDLGEIVLCKSWLQKKWKQTKKFVKKHKKEIIIGAAIVVAVAVIVTIAVVAPVAAPAIAAAGAAAASETDKAEKNISASVKEPISSAAISPAIEALPEVKDAIDEYFLDLKESVAQEEQYPEIEENSFIFVERVREVGAHFTHEILDEISDIVAPVAGFCKEISELGSKILPENLLSQTKDNQISAKENFDKSIAKGHQVVDQFFGTDQAYHHMPESRVKNPMNDFAIGILPPPSGLPKIFSRTNKLIKSAEALDRSGFTKVGRNSMKHGYRQNSVFPKPVGNPAQINAHGKKLLESILTHPEKQFFLDEFKRFGKVVDIYAPEIGGVRYTIDGQFICFLEP